VQTEKAIDYLLNLISGRLGLDHDRVLFGRYALPVLSHYVNRRGGKLTDATEQDKVLFWYLQSAMWGRFSSQSKSYIDFDLRLIEELDGGLDRLTDRKTCRHSGSRLASRPTGGVERPYRPADRRRPRNPWSSQQGRFHVLPGC